ncbi:hypothetical protein YTPLAS18_30660 [Nitrospira sp.]|nr:hypothetical protein YTPLAS18_30660 [Nitrospira sp.]
MLEADREWLIVIGQIGISIRHEAVTWHVPHRSQDGRVPNSAGDHVLLDHSFTLAFSGRLVS